MSLFRLTIAAAALSLSATFASAATVGGYTSFFAFGDSLTDNGNLFAATGGALPSSPPYFGGRFSNGPTWAEHVAARFAAAGLVSANFAFGGANAVAGGVDPVPDQFLQLAIFGATVPKIARGSNPLVSLWFGANDIFTELDKAASPTRNAITVARAAANAVVLAAFTLAQQGLDDIVLFNLPDLGKIPRFALNDLPDAAAATAAATAFNTRLGILIPFLEASGVNVIRIDVDSLFDDLIADPGQFGVGLENSTDYCVAPDLSSVCTPEQLQKLAFFDQSHPTAKVHAVIANTVLAAIPLPASVLMLGAGLVGLAALRRRAA